MCIRDRFIPALTFAHSADFIKGMGTYLGFIIGIYIEKKYVNFSTEGSTGNKIIRVLLGIVISVSYTHLKGKWR